MSISILIPTYKRPNSVVRFSKHAHSTCSKNTKIEILFGCHEDDMDTQKAIDTFPNTSYFETRCIIIPHHKDGKPHLVQYWNDIFPHSKYNVLGFFGDDVIIKTQNWDELVIQQFNKDPIQLVYGDDVHIQHGKIATLFFTHKIVHDAFGYYLYPQFRRWYMDTFMDNVFREAKKINYMPELIFEHLHPAKFSEAEDDVYIRMQPLIALDQIIWESEACRAELSRCIDLLSNLTVITSAKTQCK